MEYSEAMPVAMPQGGSSIIAVEHKAQIEALVDTAHKYPRSVKRFEEEALTMATTDQDTAAQMFYVVPRGGKTIEGISVRLAEIVAVAWGNLRYGSKVVDVGDTHITCQGYCFDMEKNVAAESEVKVRITKKDGKRYDDDMITVAGNAGCSKAMRNAIVKVVPRAYVEKILSKAKQVAIGKAMPLETQRAQAFDYIKKMGVPEERILAVIGRPSIKDVSSDDIIVLRGLATAVKDGESSVEEAFPPLVEDEGEKPAAKPSPKGAAAKAKEKLGSAEPKPAQAEIPPSDSDAFFDLSGTWSDIQKDTYSAAFNEAQNNGASNEDAHAAGFLAATN